MDTPSSSDITFRVRVSPWMASTCSGVNLVEALPVPLAWRPLLTMSFIFSCRVPDLRCKGLTHRGLSHECSTWCPEGIGPRTKRCDVRLADEDNPSRRPAGKAARPLLNIEAFHSQHSSKPRMATLLQNIYMNSPLKISSYHYLSLRSMEGRAAGAAAHIPTGRPLTHRSGALLNA